MEYLDAVFAMVLIMLNNVVNDSRIGAIFWVFILVMSLLILIKMWRGVSTWARRY